jgi:hypothetical protein
VYCCLRISAASSRGAPETPATHPLLGFGFRFPRVGREKDNGLRPVQEPLGRFNRLTSNGTAYKPGCNEVFQRERKLISTNRLDYDGRQLEHLPLAMRSSINHSRASPSGCIGHPRTWIESQPTVTHPFPAAALPLSRALFLGCSQSSGIPLAGPLLSAFGTLPSRLLAPIRRVTEQGNGSSAPTYAPCLS